MKNKIIKSLIALYTLSVIVVGACLNVGINVPFIGKMLYMPVHVTACMAADMLNAEPEEEVALAAEVPENVSLSIEAGIYRNTFYDQGKPMAYRLYIPEGATTNMPVIIWLHGQGTVNRPEKLDNHGVIRAAKEIGENRFIILQPCTSKNNWVNQLGIVTQMVDYVVDELHCDPNRIILTGHSLGAMGVWDWADRSDKWAAVVPVAEKPITSTENLINSDVPLWAFCGENDDRNIMKSMKAITDQCNEAGTHKEVRFSELEETGHNEMAYCVYTQDVFDWAFAQSK